MIHFAYEIPLVILMNYVFEKSKVFPVFGTEDVHFIAQPSISF